MTGTKKYANFGGKWYKDDLPVCYPLMLPRLNHTRVLPRLPEC